MPAPVRKGRNEQRARVAAGVNSSKPPLLTQVYAALDSGHIDENEASALHPLFDPKKQIGSPITRKKAADVIRTQKETYRSIDRGAAGLRPSLQDVHAAVKGGHIDKDEAQSLLSGSRLKYNPKNKQQTRALEYRIKERQFGRSPKIKDVYSAYRGGHITGEEASALSPKFTEGKSRYNPKTPGVKKAPARTPSLVDVHEAVRGGHVTKDEGQALNTKYNPSNKIQTRGLNKQAKLRSEKEAGVGRTPSLINVYRAHTQGHVTADEAQALNPSYDPSNRAQTTNLRNNLKQQDVKDASRQFKGGE